MIRPHLVFPFQFPLILRHSAILGYTTRLVLVRCWLRTGLQMKRAYLFQAAVRCVHPVLLNAHTTVARISWRHIRRPASASQTHIVLHWGMFIWFLRMTLFAMTKIAHTSAISRVQSPESLAEPFSRGYMIAVATKTQSFWIVRKDSSAIYVPKERTRRRAGCQSICARYIKGESCITDIPNLKKLKAIDIKKEARRARLGCWRLHESG